MKAQRQLIQTEESAFARDTSSMALINTDAAAFAHYKAQREKAMQVRDLCQEVDALKDDIKEIKQMLIQLTRKQ